jgi:hypothetical protein
MQVPRPTPTCARFQPSIEMPCLKCGHQMRLALIEPRDLSSQILTYLCGPCDSGESFLVLRIGGSRPATYICIRPWNDSGLRA